jgi:CBS domain containing-hemolysin-like protein
LPGLPQCQRQANAEDSALTLLTDLSHSAVVVASQHDSLDSTLHVMQRAGVRMVFVAGADGQLAGVVTADLLQGERPILRASNTHVAFKDLAVADVMVPISHWQVLDLTQVRTARLGDIVATMHEHGLRYLLVTQLKDGQTTLRGLFSATRLEQALGAPIGSDLHSRSFAELEAALVR